MFMYTWVNYFYLSLKTNVTDSLKVNNPCKCKSQQVLEKKSTTEGVFLGKAIRSLYNITTRLSL